MIEAFANFFEQVGADWVLWLLLGLSLLSIGVIVERIIFFHRRRVAIDVLGEQVLAALRKGGAAGAEQACRDVPGMTGGVLRAALAANDDGVEAMEEVIQATIVLERSRYDRFLNTLGTLGANAPFIGLLGTVIGVIKAFANVGVGLDLDPERASLLMDAISEALVVTAIGLAVAIPAVVAYNSFKNRIKAVSANTEWLARNILAHLKALPGDVSPRSGSEVA